MQEREASRDSERIKQYQGTSKLHECIRQAVVSSPRGRALVTCGVECEDMVQATVIKLLEEFPGEEPLELLENGSFEIEQLAWKFARTVVTKEYQKHFCIRFKERIRKTIIVESGTFDGLADEQEEINDQVFQQAAAKALLNLLRGPESSADADEHVVIDDDSRNDGVQRLSAVEKRRLEIEKRLSEVIAEVNPTHLDWVWMKFAEGVSFNEISDEYSNKHQKVSPDTVGRRCREILEKFRKILVQVAESDV